MTIRIYNNRIEFDDGSNVYTLSETTTGFSFNGNFASPGWVTSSPVMGLNYGFTAGGDTAGLYNPSSGTNSNIIDRFPFATNANATDYGDLTVVRWGLTGHSSSTTGYSAGGYTPASPTSTNVIDSFPFASAANATDVGDLTGTRALTSGQSSSFHGYTSGGTPESNVIDRFPFASNSNAADYGDLSVARHATAGQSSTSNGYNSAGYGPGAGSNVIDKFPFASAANATDVGDLTEARWRSSGQSSSVSGYTSSGTTLVSYGAPSGALRNTIDKFPFATSANATDVGDGTILSTLSCGMSSSTSGYKSGGAFFAPGQVNHTATNVIDKFPFASDSSATDVGDLTSARSGSSGHQD